MSKDLFIHAAEVAEALGISRPYAYKLVAGTKQRVGGKGVSDHFRQGEQALL